MDSSWTWAVDPRTCSIFLVMHWWPSDIDDLISISLGSVDVVHYSNIHIQCLALLCFIYFPFLFCFFSCTKFLLYTYFWRFKLFTDNKVILRMLWEKTQTDTLRNRENLLYYHFINNVGCLIRQSKMFIRWYFLSKHLSFGC